jgi:hypothetical protein
LIRFDEVVEDGDGVVLDMSRDQDEVKRQRRLEKVVEEL